MIFLLKGNLMNIKYVLAAFKRSLWEAVRRGDNDRAMGYLRQIAQIENPRT